MDLVSKEKITNIKNMRKKQIIWFIIVNNLSFSLIIGFFLLYLRAKFINYLLWTKS